MVPDGGARRAGSVRTLCRDGGAGGECGRKLVSRVNPQLAEDAREVTLDRPCSNEEGLGDLAVRVTLAGELGYTALAGCQRVDPCENDAARSRPSGAELGLGVFGDAFGAWAVGGIECFAEQFSGFDASALPMGARPRSTALPGPNMS